MRPEASAACRPLDLVAVSTVPRDRRLRLARRAPTRPPAARRPPAWLRLPARLAAPAARPPVRPPLPPRRAQAAFGLRRAPSAKLRQRTHPRSADAPRPRPEACPRPRQRPLCPWRRCRSPQRGDAAHRAAAARGRALRRRPWAQRRMWRGGARHRYVCVYVCIYTHIKQTCVSPLVRPCWPRRRCSVVWACGGRRGRGRQQALCPPSLPRGRGVEAVEAAVCAFEPEGAQLAETSCTSRAGDHRRARRGDHPLLVHAADWLLLLLRASQSLGRSCRRAPRDQRSVNRGDCAAGTRLAHRRRVKPPLLSCVEFRAGSGLRRACSSQAGEIVNRGCRRR